MQKLKEKIALPYLYGSNNRAWRLFIIPTFTHNVFEVFHKLKLHCLLKIRGQLKNGCFLISYYIALDFTSVPS